MAPRRLTGCAYDSIKYSNRGLLLSRNIPKPSWYPDLLEGSIAWFNLSKFIRMVTQHEVQFQSAAGFPDVGPFFARLPSGHPLVLGDALSATGIYNSPWNIREVILYIVGIGMCFHPFWR